VYYTAVFLQAAQNHQVLNPKTKTKGNAKGNAKGKTSTTQPRAKNKQNIFHQITLSPDPRKTNKCRS
jgi:hypothetical protein